jgi:2,4-dienoyl-CoA reductase-like NADH-dependent reductase (Old Yellow Enzyme family)
MMTSILFSKGEIGTLQLQNRLVRSATAERMADNQGRPLPIMEALYEKLARGGVGLIISGHMYIHPSGKAHSEMTGVYSDDLIPDLSRLAEVVHRQRGKVVVQINHGGMQCSDETVTERIAPSVVDEISLNRSARAMTRDEIQEMTQAYGDAARRVKEAGFDGVQIHAAHGYLINQFLSPAVNRRTDQWGGDITRRMRFLEEVANSVRKKVGPDYPMLIKLGMKDGVKGGLTLEDSAIVVAALEAMGLDALEISGGIGGKDVVNIKKGIRHESEEAYYLPFAKVARPKTHLPILLVGGMRSKTVMERVIQEGHADFISLSRPLITEPNLPDLFKSGQKDKSRCLSANNCWPTTEGEGIACKCPHDKVVG